MVMLKLKLFEIKINNSMIVLHGKVLAEFEERGNILRERITAEYEERGREEEARIRREFELRGEV